MAKNILIKVELGGNAYKHKVENIFVKQMVFHHHQFQIALNTDDIDESLKSFHEKVDKYVSKEAVIFFLDEETGNELSKFKGLITYTSLRKGAATTGDNIIVGGFSPTVIIDGCKISRSFSEKKLSDIINIVKKSADQSLLKVKVNTLEQDHTLDYATQYKETDYNFLKRLCFQYGISFYYDGEYLNIGKGKSTTTKMSYGLGPGLQAINIQHKITPIGSHYSWYNYEEDTIEDESIEDVDANISNNNLNKLLNKSSEIFREFKETRISNNAISKEDLKIIQKKNKERAVSNYIKITGRSRNPKIIPGVILEINGKEESIGKFLITSVTHSGRYNTFYENNFEGIEASSPIINSESEIERPVAAPEVARVVENDESSKLGCRIRVQFQWQEANDDKTPWLRILTPYAGKDRGQYFIPEIDDEVIVGFHHNDPDQPFVYGSVYYGKELPLEDWPNKNNEIKSIRSNNGNEIRFTDKSGKEEIKIFNEENKQEIVITLDKGGVITIRSKKEVNVLAETINIKASDTINMEAKDVNVDCDNFKLKADKMQTTAQNTDLSSSSKMNIKGGSKLSVSATQIDMN